MRYEPLSIPAAEPFAGKAVEGGVCAAADQWLDSYDMTGIR